MYKRGEITVFLSLICLVILAYISALIMSARNYSTKTRIESLSDIVTKSVFSEYDKELFDNYGLLYIDTTYRGTLEGGKECLAEHISQYVDVNLEEDKNMFSISYLSAEISDVVYASDDEFSSLINQISEYMILTEGYEESTPTEELIQEYMTIKNISLTDEEEIFDEYYLEEQDNNFTNEIEQNNNLSISEMIETITEKIENEMREKYNDRFDFDHLISSAKITYFFDNNDLGVYECQKEYSFTNY